jgi:UDP-glucose:(heptosyl)LPS alpha-1,3-glucosyltransferase
LKVALVILHADPARGGAERYTFDLAEALVRRGHGVTLIASTLGPRPAGVECVELGERGVTRLGKYQRFLDRLDRHLDAGAYDIVHAMLPVRRCDVYHPHAGVAAEAVESGHAKHAGAVKRELARLANRVNVKRRAFARVERELLGRESSPHPDPLPEYRARGSTGGPVVLCLSEYVKGMVRKHYPALGDDRLATLFNAVDQRRFDPAKAAARERPANQVVGLMVAQDFERKGLREAITGLARADDARLVLNVVGKPDPSEYRDLARSLDVGEAVHFLGPILDVYGAYAAADFFVLPTRHDPCSLVVLEALAMGLPVISTKRNGACEIMTPGEHGFILDSADDVDGLAVAMRSMCDAANRKRMSEACLALRPKLAYDAHLDTLMRIYQGVLDRRGRGSGDSL